MKSFRSLPILLITLTHILNKDKKQWGTIDLNLKEAQGI